MGKTIAIIIGISIAIIATFLVIGLGSNSMLNSISTQKQTIVDATIVVPPSQYVVYSIERPYSDSSNCKIQGTFSASGGQDDIRVFVIEEFEFNNFKNGLPFQSYYSTPQQVDGDIMANVPCDKFGQILLVYDNSFSLVTDKTVDTKVFFEYEK